MSQVVSPDALMPTAESLARRICENRSPLRTRHPGPRLPRRQHAHNEALHLVHTLMSALYESADSKEGPKAFSEKRKPNYQAR